MRTHIQTLADNTPKARRRVRRTLGFGNVVLIDRTLVSRAQVAAGRAETRGADADKLKTATRRASR